MIWSQKNCRIFVEDDNRAFQFSYPRRPSAFRYIIYPIKITSLMFVSWLLLVNVCAYVRAFVCLKVVCNNYPSTSLNSRQIRVSSTKCLCVAVLVRWLVGRCNPHRHSCAIHRHDIIQLNRHYYEK